MLSIKEIKSKNARSCYEFDFKSIKHWNQNQWENEIEKDSVTAIGLYLNNSILGVCVFHKIFDEAEIRYLSVHPAYKRKGLGKILIRYVFKECENENIKRIFLEVSLTNKPAISFYNSFGFKTISIRKNYYKDGSDALLKKKFVK